MNKIRSGRHAWFQPTGKVGRPCLRVDVIFRASKLTEINLQSVLAVTMADTIAMLGRSVLACSHLSSLSCEGRKE
jgi:hypothetical protein